MIVIDEEKKSLTTEEAIEEFTAYFTEYQKNINKRVQKKAEELGVKVELRMGVSIEPKETLKGEKQNGDG